MDTYTLDIFDFERIPPDSPKLMNLREIGVDHAMRYNADWHSRLPKTVKGNLLRNTHYMFYGAEYKDHCFASAIWTTPVANNRLSKEHKWLELRRLAVAPDAPKFTATWMIAKMVKDISKRYPEITKLVSYQDTGVHTGTIYKAANWVLDQQSNKLQDWSTSKRKRNKLQSDAPKNRWVYEI
jgi:hypothetical protein